jgi:hypothetical protein
LSVKRSTSFDNTSSTTAAVVPTSGDTPPETSTGTSPSIN